MQNNNQCTYAVLSKHHLCTLVLLRPENNASCRVLGQQTWPKCTDNLLNHSGARAILNESCGRSSGEQRSRASSVSGLACSAIGLVSDMGRSEENILGFSY
ncbi:hypothetical protein SADUNF_Sadunf19G0019600 [Salix dunnii]|uniref:Uncharacterized protein n=1 Tax=Salix dunnii TaxID=1413687 RepID=A0A835J3D5_9ROSI|nr:hypothetical protein SADUNF_Sadunf19G0019600 [Salix dunnii]